MIFYSMIAISCGLIRLCPDTYCRPLRRRNVSFLVLLWYFSTLVFAVRVGCGARAKDTARRHHYCTWAYCVYYMVP